MNLVRFAKNKNKSKTVSMAFLRNLLATILGLFIFSFLGILVLVGIASSSSEETVEVKDNSVLYLPLGGILSERTPEDPFQEFFPNSGPSYLGVLDLLKVIKNAKTDDKIKGIYIEHGYLSGGFASLKEVRDALLDFKTSGKFIYSYGNYISEGDYYIGSVADELYVNPQGSLEFNGFSANISFFKGTLDKLEIEPLVFRVGEFKSAIEPFIRKDMSPENELQIKSFLNSAHETFLADIAEARNIPAEKLKEISSEMKVRRVADAVDYGLATKVAYEDEMKTLLKIKLGIEESADITFISWKKYKKSISPDEISKNRIAVIVAEGEILMGEGEDGQIGAEKFAREIRNARESDRIKAVVLRINSPGGSLTGSDIIWREIMLTKEKKPIIASMGDYAASGGYYLSMPCDTIVAQPNTITGSIGIFGMMFNMEKFLENKLGITFDVVKTGEYSDIMTVTRSLSDFEKQIIQDGVNEGYETFTSKAAEARRLPIEKLKELAGGRVWTGIQAHELGLVDLLGSFDDAVKIAADKAELGDDYLLSFYPKQKNFFEEMFSSASNELEARSIKNNYGMLAPYVKEIRDLQHYEGIQARMPYSFEIK